MTHLERRNPGIASFVLAALVSISALLAPGNATSGPLRNVVLPVDDTYVKAGLQSRRNFGKETSLELSASRTSASEVYLKFDIKSFDVMLSDAKLRFYAAADGNEPASILVLSCSNDWLENTMTWKDKPDHASTIGRIDVIGSAPAWHEVDVSSFLRTQLAGATDTVSFVLLAESGSNVRVNSRESDSNPPELVSARQRFIAKIAFRPATSPKPPGYLVDSGEEFGLRQNGFIYGWTVANKYVWDRNAASAKDPKPAKAPDVRYAGTIFMDHPEMKNPLSWQFVVPNGKYKVHLVAGDAAYYDSVYVLQVEDVITIDSIPDANKRWSEGTQTVTVTDNRLTVSNHAKGVNNKLCFIEISEQVDDSASAK